MSDGTLFLRGKRFWIDITDAAGTRHRIPTGTGDKVLAEAKLTETRRSLFYGQALVNGAAASRLTLAAACRKAMLEHYAALSDRAGVQKHYDFLLAHLPEGIRVDQITQDHVTTLLAKMQERGNKFASINRKFTSLRMLFKLAEGWGAIERAPKLPHFKETGGRIRVYTDEEEARVLAWFKDVEPFMYDVTVVLLDAGLRLGELVNRDWLIHDRKLRLVRVDKTKNGKGRAVPLTERADVSLARHLKQPPWTDNQIEWEWRKMRASLGYTKDAEFVIHALRHTCCTRLIREGHDASKVQLWMGHKTLETTMKYTHLDVSDLVPMAASLQKRQEVSCGS